MSASVGTVSSNVRSVASSSLLWARKALGRGENAQTRQILFVTESRLGSDSVGDLWTATYGLSGRGWARSIELPNLALTSRVHHRTANECYRLNTSKVYPLPDYQGLTGLLKNVPLLIWKLAAAVKYSQVVVVRVPTASAPLATVICKLLGRPVAVEVVGDAEDLVMSGILPKSGRFIAPITTAIYRWVVREGVVIRYMTASALQEKYPARTGAVAVSASSVRLEPSDFNVWSESAKSARPTILAIGSQETPYKGHQHLIEATSRLRERIPDVCLVLIGQGRHQAELRQLVQALDVESHVSFRGYVSSREDIRRAFADAWVVAHPSMTEGLPRALIEACAAGVPAVASRAGGSKELVSPKRQFDPGDILELERLLEQMLTSEEARRVASNENRATAQRFTPDQVGKSLIEWNRELASLVQASGRHRRRRFTRGE